MSRWKPKLSHTKNGFKMLPAVKKQQKTSHTKKLCNILSAMLKLNPSKNKNQFLLLKWSYTLPVTTKEAVLFLFPFHRTVNKHQNHPSPYVKVLSQLALDTNSPAAASHLEHVPFQSFPEDGLRSAEMSFNINVNFLFQKQTKHYRCCSVQSL